MSAEIIREHMDAEAENYPVLYLLSERERGSEHQRAVNIKEQD